MDRSIEPGPSFADRFPRGLEADERLLDDILRHRRVGEEPVGILEQRGFQGMEEVDERLRPWRRRRRVTGMWGGRHSMFAPVLLFQNHPVGQ